MPSFRADMHIHSVLSPCASLEMSPTSIVQTALDARLDIIAITDHNSTRQVKLTKKIGTQNGLLVLGGVEVNTAEEVHCLALFETDEQLDVFQKYIDLHILKIKNKTDYFGYQVVVDEQENIVYEEPWLLISALDTGIFDVEKKVHSLDGLFIPAHIDRPHNGIISQLGFIPDGLKYDALELSGRADIADWQQSKKIPLKKPMIRNSDAHRPEEIGKHFTIFELEKLTFDEIKRALNEQRFQI